MQIVNRLEKCTTFLDLKILLFEKQQIQNGIKASLPVCRTSELVPKEVSGFNQFHFTALQSSPYDL